MKTEAIHKCRLLYAKELKIRWNIWYTDSVRRHDCMEFILSAHFLIFTILWNCRLKFVSWPDHDNWHIITTYVWGRLQGPTKHKSCWIVLNVFFHILYWILKTFCMSSFAGNPVNLKFGNNNHIKVHIQEVFFLLKSGVESVTIFRNEIGNSFKIVQTTKYSDYDFIILV